jgi:hypothetical protein
MNWQPIESYRVPEFSAETWYRGGPRVLLWNGNYADIGTYGYTQKGKGRWRDHMGRITIPTHWMPLPSGPISNTPTE